LYFATHRRNALPTHPPSRVLLAVFRVQYP
jgi:hypothetical protein